MSYTLLNKINRLEWLDVKTDLQLIIKNFGNEAEFIEDGYYRIRSLDDSTWELAFLVAGHCGERLVHPKIQCTLTNSALVGKSLMDMAETPTVHIVRTAETSDLLDNELKKLIAKFLQAKNLG